MTYSADTHALYHAVPVIDYVSWLSYARNEALLLKMGYFKIY